jgi:cell division protein FtsQ
MMQASRRAVAETATLSLPEKQTVLRHVSLLVVVMAALAFLAGAIQVVQHWLATASVASVQVDGDLRHVDKRLVAEALAPVVTGNYFTADLVAIHDVVSASDWVEEVRVSRRWPNGIRIHIREKQPVALWGQQKLISSRGELFAPVHAERMEGLPVLFGPESKSVQVMEQYRAMNSVLRGLGMTIVELELTERMSWFLRLDNGIRLVIDQVDTIEKLQRFAYLYERQLKPDAENIASIDLRYRNGVSVGWKVQKSIKNTTPSV